MQMQLSKEEKTFYQFFLSAPEYLYPIVSSFWQKLSWKTSLLLGSEIFRLFVDTSTSNDKYSGHTRGISHNRFKVQLSQKSKAFC